MIKLNVEGYPSTHIAELEDRLRGLADRDGNINVRVEDEDKVRELNSRYADKDMSTDVLSFSYIESQPEAGTPSAINSQSPTPELGDIIISRQHLTSQADAAGTDEETEFILLLLHGALHILGYDHDNERDRRHMDDVQSRIMGELGLVYRDFNWQSDYRE